MGVALGVFLMINPQNFTSCNTLPPYSLQKFKLSIANTVIGQDNSNLQSMNTSELLDLFQVSEAQGNWGKEKVWLQCPIV